ncbi:MAG: hypothetical protein WEC79_06010 [Thermomicrobiales bacterium]
MATTLHSPHKRHTIHLPHPHRGGRGQAGPWLIAVGIAACLALVVAGLAVTDNLPGVSGDDASVRTQVQAYDVPGQGDGLLSDSHRAVAAPAQLDPISRYEDWLGEGWLDEGFNPGDIVSDKEQARLAYDEMLFDALNDPLGWQAIPERPAVMSSEQTRFLELNGVYADAADLSYLERPAVLSWERMRFLELNGVYADTGVTTTTSDAPAISYECVATMGVAQCLEYEQNTALPTSGTRDDGIRYRRPGEGLIP